MRNPFGITRLPLLINPTLLTQPKSLFYLCFAKLWQFKKFRCCSCRHFHSRFSCEYCYKTLVTMQNEYITNETLMHVDNQDKNYSIIVDTFKCNPTEELPCYEKNLKNVSGMYLHDFDYITIRIKTLSILRKYIILHCLFQFNVLRKVALPDYLYSMTFSIKENSDRWWIRYGDDFWFTLRGPVSCANFIKYSYYLLLQNDEISKYKRTNFNVAIVLVKSKKTKHHILSKNDFFQNVLIAFYTILTVVLFLILLIYIINGEVHIFP